MVTASPDEENKRNRTRDIETNSESRSPVGRRRFLQAAGAGATVALAGCSGGSGDDDVVRLGATYILSGFASLYGEAAERGLEMAQSEINDNGGIDGRDVEVTVRDTEASADTAIQQMRSLVEEDNVHGLFGLDSSGVAQAVAPQAAQLQMPYMITHAATPFVTSPEGEHEDSVGNDYVFRDSNSLSQDIYGAALTAAELDATGGRRSAPTTRSATRRGTTSRLLCGSRCRRRVHRRTVPAAGDGRLHAVHQFDPRRRAGRRAHAAMGCRPHHVHRTGRGCGLVRSDRPHAVQRRDGNRSRERREPAPGRRVRLDSVRPVRPRHRGK